MVLYYLSLLPVVEADPSLSLLHFHSMSVCGEKPHLPVVTEIDVLSHADHNESTGNAWIIFHLHCWMICFSDSTADVCVSFGVAVCNQFASLFSELYSRWMCWFYCFGWLAVLWVKVLPLRLFAMSHVAPVQADLNPINAELSVSLVVKAPSLSSHVTLSKICYISSSADLLSTSDPTIERQEVMNPPCMIVIRSCNKYMINTVLFLNYLCL